MNYSSSQYGTGVLQFPYHSSILRILYEVVEWIAAWIILFNFVGLQFSFYNFLLLYCSVVVLLTHLLKKNVLIRDYE
jgi:hypothetical protein